MNKLKVLNRGVEDGKPFVHLRYAMHYYMVLGTGKERVVRKIGSHLGTLSTVTYKPLARNILTALDAHDGSTKNADAS